MTDQLALVTATGHVIVNPPVLGEAPTPHHTSSCATLPVPTAVLKGTPVTNCDHVRPSPETEVSAPGPFPVASRAVAITSTGLLATGVRDAVVYAAVPAELLLPTIGAVKPTAAPTDDESVMVVVFAPADEAMMFEA